MESSGTPNQNGLPYDDLPISQGTGNERPLSKNQSPINWEAQFLNYQNRVECLNEKIRNQREHGKNLFSEFFSLMFSTELFAFDLFMFYYDLGGSHARVIRQFIEDCCIPKFNFQNPTIDNIKNAGDHIYNVHQTIHNLIHQIEREIGRPVEPPNTQKFKELCDKIEQKMEPFKAPSLPQPQTVSIPHPFPSSSLSTLYPISSDFQNWASDYLKITTRDIDEPTALNRSMFGKLLFRIGTIERLKKEITEIQRKTASPNAPTLKPSVYNESPYFKSLLGNSTFLRKTILLSHAYEDQIQQCIDSLDKKSSDFNTLQETCNNTLEKIKTSQASIKASTERRFKTFKELTAQTLPFVDLLLPEKKSAEIVNYLNEIKSLEEIINEQIPQKLESIKARSQETNNHGIEALPDLFEELQSLREEVVKLTEDCVESRRKCALGQNGLYRLYYSELRTDETNRLYRKELDTHKKFNTLLNEYKMSINFQKVTNWTARMKTVNDQLSWINEQEQNIKQAINELERQISNDEEIEMLEKEYNELQQQKHDLIIEEINLNEELEEQKEELFKQLQMNEIYRKYMKSSTQMKERKYEMEEFKKQLICSQCNERIADVIINKKKCRHAFCEQCAKNNDQCPICNNKYSKSNILKFYFNS